MNSAPLKINIGASVKCPYICSKNDSARGYISEILKKSLPKKKYDLSIVNYPHARLKEGLRDGTFDMILLPSFEIKNDFDLKSLDSILGIHFIGVAYLKSTPPVRRIKDFINKRILMTSGSYYTNEAAIKLNKLNIKKDLVSIITGKNVEIRKLKMLKLKRADYILADYNILSHLITIQSLEDEVALTSSSIAGFTPLVLVTRENFKPSGTIDKRIKGHIRKIRKNGKLKKLLESYSTSDWYLHYSR